MNNYEGGYWVALIDLPRFLSWEVVSLDKVRALARELLAKPLCDSKANDTWYRNQCMRLDTLHWTS